MTALHDVTTTGTQLSEKALLGALMVWPEELHDPDGRPRVSPEDFSDARHGTVLQVIRAAWEKHSIRDDLPALAGQFTAEDLARVGGPVALFDLLEGRCQRASIPLLAEAVANGGGWRRIRMAVDRVRHELEQTPPSTAEAMDASRAAMWEELQRGLTSTDGGAGLLVDVGGTAVTVLNQLRAGDRPTGIGFGVECVDKLVPLALAPGKLCLVGARPGVGKSAWLVVTALHAMKQGRSVLLVSLEMDAASITRRLIASHSGVSLSRLMERPEELSADEWVRLDEAERFLQGARMRILDRATAGISDIRQACRAASSLGQPLDLILVDYVQLLKVERQAESRAVDVAELTRGLKAVAKEHAPVLAAVQLNRNAEGSQPRLDQLKESGALEEAADIVILLHRDRLEDPEGDTPTTHVNLPEMQVIVAKNREGATGIRTVSPSLHNSRIYSL